MGGKQAADRRLFPSSRVCSGGPGPRPWQALGQGWSQDTPVDPRAWRWGMRDYGYLYSFYLGRVTPSVLGKKGGEMD